MRRKSFIVCLCVMLLSLFFGFAACNFAKDENKDELVLSETNLNIALNETAQLKAFFNGVENNTVTWTTSAESVCTVEQGLVTAIKLGTATISASLNGISADCVITVDKIETYPVLTLSKQAVVLQLNEEVLIQADVLFKTQPIQPVITWTSENESVATVSNGKIKGVGFGNTAIKVEADYNGATVTKEIAIIVKPDLDVVFESNNVELKTDEVLDPTSVNYQLAPQIFENEQPYTQVEIEYISEDETVATVSQSGLISSVSVGNTKIVVRITAKGCVFDEYIQVTVKKSEKVFDRELFETCVSIAEDTPIYNNILIDVSEYTDLTEADYAIEQGGQIIQNGTMNRAGKNLVLSGEVFGYEISGELALRINLEKVDLIYPLNVVTKKISTLKDLQNMALYGGVDPIKDPKKMAYGGYFLLMNNIKCDYTPILDKKNYEGKDLDSRDGDFGFYGVFDGQGYTISELSTDNGGLFGNVQSSAVIKNLAVVGRITAKECGVFGIKVNGTIQNCYINVVVVSGLEYSVVVGHNLSNSTLKDIVVVSDASAAKQGLKPPVSIHGYLGYHLGGATKNKEDEVVIIGASLAHMENIYAFVKSPEGCEKPSTPASCYYASYTKDHLKAIKEYDYAESAAATFSDNSLWTTHQGKPIFKTVQLRVEIVAQTPFEVYNSTVMGVVQANSLQINVGNSGISNVESVTLVGGKNKVEVDSYTFSGGILTISGSAFGASIYGDVEILIQDGEKELAYKTKVVTKYINSLDDLKNLGLYGGIASTATDGWAATNYHIYDGYFVLTKTLDANKAEYKKNFAAYTGDVSATMVYSGKYAGFKGTFDGQGYSVKNLYLTGLNGIFGNVHRQGVVKNLGVSAFIKGNEVGVLARQFNGRLVNCYIQVAGYDTTSLTRTGPIAFYTTKMEAIDVVVKFDATTATTAGYIAFAVSTIDGDAKPALNPTFMNVHAFVKQPSTALNPSFGFHDKLLAVDTYKGITTYAYETEATVEFTNSDFWATQDGQPIFVSMIANA